LSRAPDNTQGNGSMVPTRGPARPHGRFDCSRAKRGVPVTPCRANAATFYPGWTRSGEHRQKGGTGPGLCVRRDGHSTDPLTKVLTYSASVFMDVSLLSCGTLSGAVAGPSARTGGAARRGLSAPGIGCGRRPAALLL